MAMRIRISPGGEQMGGSLHVAKNGEKSLSKSALTSFIDSNI